MGIRIDRLKQLRKEHGWTLQDLADKCGITKAQIYRYETGGSEPPADKLKLLAGLFGVTSDYLLGLIDSPALYGLPGDGELSPDERTILETFRRESWKGLLLVVAQEIAK